MIHPMADMWINTYENRKAESLPTQWMVKASCSRNWSKWFVDKNDIIWEGRNQCIDVLNLQKFQFDLIGRYNKKGVGRVKVWKKYWIANSKWELIVPVEYDGMESDHDGDMFIGYKKDVGYELIDSEWNVITKEPCCRILFTQELERYWIAWLIRKEKKWKEQLIDFEGNPIWKWYDDIFIACWDCHRLKDNYWLIKVGDNKKYGAINVRWEEVIPLILNSNWDIEYEIHDYGNYKIVKFMDKMGLIKDGKCIVPIWELKKVYNWCDFFEVNHDWKNYLFDREFKLKTSGYDSLKPWVMGESWKARKNGKAWLYNSEFETIVPFKYVDLWCYKYWYVIVEKDNNDFCVFDLREQKEIRIEDCEWSKELKHLPEAISLMNFIFKAR